MITIKPVMKDVFYCNHINYKLMHSFYKKHDWKDGDYGGNVCKKCNFSPSRYNSYSYNPYYNYNPRIWGSGQEKWLCNSLIEAVKFKDRDVEEYCNQPVPGRIKYESFAGQMDNIIEYQKHLLLRQKIQQYNSPAIMKAVRRLGFLKPKPSLFRI